MTTTLASDETELCVKVLEAVVASLAMNVGKFRALRVLWYVSGCASDDPQDEDLAYVDCLNGVFVVLQRRYKGSAARAIVRLATRKEHDWNWRELLYVE